jgi:hypothetical protein
MIIDPTYAVRVMSARVSCSTETDNVPARKEHPKTKRIFDKTDPSICARGKHAFHGDIRGPSTHGSLHDPDFSLEERDDAHDDFHRVPKRGVQQPRECLPEGQGHLFGGIAKQLGNKKKDPR